nr:immunoglobulin light chain junction region [Macaca mulatta]
CQQNNYWPLTF